MKTKMNIIKILPAYLFLFSTGLFAGSKTNVHIDGFLTGGFGVLTASQIDVLEIDQTSLATRLGLGSSPV